MSLVNLLKSFEAYLNSGTPSAKTLQSPSKDYQEESKVTTQQNGLVSSYAFDLGWTEAINYANGKFVGEYRDSYRERKRVELEQNGVVSEYAFNVGFDICLDKIQLLNNTHYAFKSQESYNYARAKSVDK
jgi:predicted nucleic acid-binding protein